jgi:DNA-binding HxlR family transcriptional regulator
LPPALKWKPLILYYLERGPQRYGQSRRDIPDASKKVLTGQLRQLEKDEIVSRAVSGKNSLQVEYSLTPYGRTLSPILKLMAEWGNRHNRLVLSKRIELTLNSNCMPGSGTDLTMKGRHPRPE